MQSSHIASMEELITYLREFGQIEPADEERIRAHASKVKLCRNDIFLEQGEVPSRVGYVASGVLGALRQGRCGDDSIAYFVRERTFATGFSDFNRGVPSAVCIQAVADSMVIVLNDVAIGRLSKCISTWDELVRILSGRDMVESLAKRAVISGDDARTRYLNFEMRYPGLVDQIPQSTVSAYLGMAPATVSRIRKKLRGKTNLMVRSGHR